MSTQIVIVIGDVTEAQLKDFLSLNKRFPGPEVFRRVKFLEFVPHIDELVAKYGRALDGAYREVEDQYPKKPTGHQIDVDRDKAARVHLSEFFAQFGTVEVSAVIFDPESYQNYNGYAAPIFSQISEMKVRPYLWLAREWGSMEYFGR